MNAAPSRVDPLGVRRLVPEILDRLPATDPRAIRSRRDLHRINRLMRQAAIADKMIRRHLAPGNAALNILELGAGDGRTVLRLARRLARHRPAVCLTLLDMAPTVAQGTCAEITALGWQVRIVTADAFSWLAASDQHFDLAITNLFLHHFDNPDLLTLLQLISGRCDLLVATEPLRSRLSLTGSKLVGLIGANDVTRHDAPASVRAGFRGNELGALWTQACGVVLEEGTRIPFTHAFAGKSASAKSGNSKL